MNEQTAKTSVTVRIGGEEYALRTNAAPAYTERCAQLVDERIAEIRAQAALVDRHKAAVLAALSITDQYFQARDAQGALEKRIHDLSDLIESRIEDALAEID